MQSVYVPSREPIDFCALTTITEGSLNYAMRLVNFTGYTGSIAFPPKNRVRFGKSWNGGEFSNFPLKDREFFVYQFQESFNDAKYIGNYSIYGPNFNSAVISFPSGKTPFSGKQKKQMTFDLTNSW